MTKTRKQEKRNENKRGGKKREKKRRERAEFMFSSYFNTRRQQLG